MSRDRSIVVQSPWGADTADGQLIRATLWGLLPNFEGYDKEKNHKEFIGPRQERGRDVQIELYQRADRITVSELLVRMGRVKSSNAVSGRGGKYDDLRYGLEYYQSDDRGDDIYRADGAPVILIECPTQLILKNMPFPSCVYLWDISEGTSYQMQYSMTYLPQWREIWENAKELLNAE